MLSQFFRCTHEPLMSKNDLKKAFNMHGKPLLKRRSLLKSCVAGYAAMPFNKQGVGLE